MSEHPADEPPADEHHADEPPDASRPTDHQRHVEARRWLAGHHASAAVIGVLTLLLGFAIAVQVHANSSTDSLETLPDNDLIGILDNQDDRAQRLRQQLAELQQNLQQLQDSGDRSAAARAQAEQQDQALGVLLGTLPAHGPGVVVTVTDPSSKLDGEDLLDVVEELRGAGAEAIQAGSVRVGTSTSFTGDPGSVEVDGHPFTPPYTFVAIGDANTLDTALNIPGGVAASVRADGGQLTVSERKTVSITVTRALPKTGDVTPSP